MLQPCARSQCDDRAVLYSRRERDQNACTMTKKHQAIKRERTKLQAFSEALRSRSDVYHRQYRLDQRMRRVVAELPEQVDRPNLRALYRDWGDPLVEDDWQFIDKCVDEALLTEGPILQCGSSFATFVLGAICHASASPEKHLWTLEHQPQWGNLVRARLAQYAVEKAHIINTPAEIFDDFVWYVIDPGKLPANFTLVICDGSRALPSGVQGLLTRFGDRLDHRCVILVRNIKRPKDLNFAAKWAKQHGAPFILDGKEQPYVKIALRDQRPESVLTEDRTPES